MVSVKSIDEKTLELSDYQPLKNFSYKVAFTPDFDTWAGLITDEDLLGGVCLRSTIELNNEPCLWLYYGSVIYVDAKIGLYGWRDLNANSKLIVGDLKTDKLIDVWRSKEAKNQRKRFYNGDFPDIWQRCTN